MASALRHQRPCNRTFGVVNAVAAMRGPRGGMAGGGTVRELATALIHPHAKIPIRVRDDIEVAVVIDVDGNRGEDVARRREGAEQFEYGGTAAGKAEADQQRSRSRQTLAERISLHDQAIITLLFCRSRQACGREPVVKSWPHLAPPRH